MAKQIWFVCDKGICLYDGAAVSRMLDRPNGPNDPRCIKHGALLFSDPAYDGLSRKQAKQKLERDDH